MSSSSPQLVQRIRWDRYYISRVEQNPLAGDMHQAVNYLSQELYSRTASSWRR
jgi:sacsin